LTKQRGQTIAEIQFSCAIYEFKISSNILKRVDGEMWSTCLSNMIFGWNHLSDSVQSAADSCAITAAYSKKKSFLQTSCSKNRDTGCVQRCPWFSYCKLSMCCLEDESGDISSL